MATPKNRLKYSVSRRTINNFEGKIVYQNFLWQKLLILQGTEISLQFSQNFRNLSNIYIFLLFFQISVYKACDELCGCNSSLIVY